MEEELIRTLQELYGMELMASLMEFCQGEIRVLLYLKLHQAKEVNPSDLSSQLFVSRQRITSVLTALRKKGYVRMEMDETDRRRMLVTLTAEGDACVSAKKAEVEGYVQRLTEGLGEKDARQLIGLLQKCIGIMELFQAEPEGRQR